METKDIVLLAVTLLILGEVSYLLTRLPKTNIKAKDRAILVDTSVLMDGRIVAVAGTGFIGGTLVIPRSVIGELQFLADHADSDKRARARHGLDVVTELQAMERVAVELLQDGSRASEGVDDRLLLLAKQHGAVIMTLDYNLNKVAAVEGTEVLNLNELAQSLRMEYLPGEKLILTIARLTHSILELIQKGQDSHQAVGYLPDGTMVVVEQASSKIGQTHTVEIVRSLQTAAGRMMFAKLVNEVQPEKRRTQRQSSKSHGASSTAASGELNKAAKSQAANNTSNELAAPSTSNQRRRGKNTSSVQRSSTAAQARPAKTAQSSRMQRTPEDSKASRRTRTSRKGKDGAAVQDSRSQPNVNAAPRRTNHSRRKNHEDNLIALVNEQ